MLPDETNRELIKKKKNLRTSLWLDSQVSLFVISLRLTEYPMS